MVVCVNVIANFHPTARPILIENVNTLINTHTHAHICICNVVLNAAAALINIIRLETFLPDCLLGFARFVLDAAHRRFNASAVQLIGCKVLLISLWFQAVSSYHFAHRCAVLSNFEAKNCQAFNTLLPLAANMTAAELLSATQPLVKYKLMILMDISLLWFYFHLQPYKYPPINDSPLLLAFVKCHFYVLAYLCIRICTENRPPSDHRISLPSRTPKPPVTAAMPFIHFMPHRHVSFNRSERLCVP